MRPGAGGGVVVSLGPGSSQQVQGRGHGAAGLLPGSLDRSPPSPTLSPEHLAAGHAHVPLTLWLSLTCRPRLRGPVPRHPRPEGSRSPPLTAGPAPAPAPPRPSGAVPMGGPESSSAAAWSQAGAAGGGGSSRMFPRARHTPARGGRWGTEKSRELPTQMPLIDLVCIRPGDSVAVGPLGATAPVTAQSRCSSKLLECTPSYKRSSS